MGLSVWQRQYDMLKAKRDTIDRDLADLEHLASTPVIQLAPELVARTQRIKDKMIATREWTTNAMKEAEGHL